MGYRQQRGYQRQVPPSVIDQWMKDLRKGEPYATQKLIESARNATKENPSGGNSSGTGGSDTGGSDTGEEFLTGFHPVLQALGFSPRWVPNLAPTPNRESISSVLSSWPVGMKPPRSDMPREFAIAVLRQLFPTDSPARREVEKWLTEAKETRLISYLDPIRAQSDLSEKAFPLFQAFYKRVEPYQERIRYYREFGPYGFMNPFLTDDVFLPIRSYAQDRLRSYQSKYGAPYKYPPYLFTWDLAPPL